MAGGARLVLLPIFLSREGFSATFIGGIFSLRALISTLTRLIIGPVMRFCGGRFRTLLLFLVLYAVGVATTPLCRTPGLLAANVVLIGVGIAMVMPLTMATVADSAPREDRSVAMSVRLAGNRLGQMVGPLGFGALAEVVGIAGAFWAAGGAMLAGTIAVALWWRNR
jgi:MFS family permease